MAILRPITRLSGRDAVLILLGAFSMHVWSIIYGPPPDSRGNSLVVNTHFNSTWQVGHQPEHSEEDGPSLNSLKEKLFDKVGLGGSAQGKQKVEVEVTFGEVDVIESKAGSRKWVDSEGEVEKTESSMSTEVVAAPPVFDVAHAPHLPHTTIRHHAPGWTLFDNVYVSNGTLFVVAPATQHASMPDRLYITSTGLKAENTEENIRARLPTERELQVITPEEAESRWGKAGGGKRNRVWTIEGNTLLWNDPDQFLNHYYHFVAELLLGVWAFWSGASPPGHASPADFTRAIFPHVDASGWRDKPNFNTYVLRAAFPSLAVEHQEDWADRVLHTSDLTRAYHFETLLLADRSASFKGEVCGSKNQRVAAEAYEYMRKNRLLELNGNEFYHPGREGQGSNAVVDGKVVEKAGEGWWEPVRKRIVEFAGGDPENPYGKLSTVTTAKKPNANQVDLEGSVHNMPVLHTSHVEAQAEPIVITYISRQGARRHLLVPDHESLVESLEALVARRNEEKAEKAKGRRWELIIVQAENLTKDEQVMLAARTTILLGVHGNGLTHLVLMPPSPLATVIEIFYPQGFAYDYEWTSRALGIRHFAIWNDSYHTYPDHPNVDYPEGFQGTQIPVNGPFVAKLIEDRVDGRVP